MNREDATQSTTSAAGSYEEGPVAGERGIPSVNRTRSLQAKISNALAMGLMGSIGIGMLTWYFANASSRQARTDSAARSSTQDKVASEMLLPALGERPGPTPIVEQMLGPAPELPDEYVDGIPDESLLMRDPVYPTVPPGTAHKTPAQLALERKLSGPVFVADTGGSSSPVMTSSDASFSAQMDESRRQPEGLDDWMVPTVTPAAVAGVLPTTRLLLPKGSFVDCTLETALDSTLPGMATCITASDTFSVDGRVVLLERGTKLVGESRGSVKQGQARIFVLWTQARTPTGVVVELASPGTDELGRSGLPGEVDRHFMERFGAAMLISLIDGIVQSAVQSSMDGATVIYNPSTSQDILTEVLRSTVNIPPTVRKQQGDRIQVLVARDLDFRGVYRLRMANESAHVVTGR